MHICFICNEYPPAPHGGIGTMTQTLGRSLVRRGCEVSVIGLSRTQHFQVEDDLGMQIIRVPSSKLRVARVLLNGLRLRMAIRQLHRKSSIDIIDGPEDSFGFIPPQFSTKKVIRISGGHHFFAATLGKKPRPLRSFVERKSFQHADSLCAVSHFVAETTRDLLGLGDIPIAILPNPVDTDFFQPNATGEEVGLVLFVGTIVEKKGVKQLVQAMNDIVKAVPYARLLLIGRDHPDPVTKKSTVALLRNMIPPELTSHVLFNGPIPHSELPQHLARAQVCVFPSHMEAQGIVIIESMAMEKATVCTETGPGPEIVEDGISGLLCNPYSPNSIAENVIRLLQDATQRQKLATAARQRAITWFGIENITDANLSFYDKVKARV